MPARKFRKTRPRSVRPNIVPLMVDVTTPLIGRERAALFTAADRHAYAILLATVTNATGMRTEQVDEALADLTRRSSYYPEADERNQDDANLMIACQEAGLMLGVAFGLRLRGPA